MTNERISLIELTTNRDLYLAIAALCNTHLACPRSLEDYLLAMLERLPRYADRDALTLAEFYELISSSFTRDTAAFEDAWREHYDQLAYNDDNYLGLRSTLIRQIVDLREMDENGTLKDEQRYFGINSPRKSRWYNLDSCAYLECAMAGSFGGWEPGDDTGRQFVPGPVAVLDDVGSIQTANPEDLERPSVEMLRVTWEQFKDFIICGQNYE